MSREKIISEILNDYLIPDLTNIVLEYSRCNKCKTYLQGKLKCICSNYMCCCNGTNICKKCEKVICNNCNKSKYCCYNKNQHSCSFCFTSIDGYEQNQKHVCLFKNCKTNMCKKCWYKFKGLCRGHILLKINNKDHPEFQGIIGL